MYYLNGGLTESGVLLTTFDNTGLLYCQRYKTREYSVVVDGASGMRANVLGGEFLCGRVMR